MARIISLFMILCCTTAISLLGTACGHTPVRFDFSADLSGETLDCTAGDLIAVTLPTGNETDYFWKEAKPVDPAVLMRLDIKQGKAENLKTGKMENVIQYQYRVTNRGFGGISLEFSNGTQIKKRFDLLIRAKGKPVQLEDMFKDGPPPDTMVDSKGNVHQKPKHLLDK